MESLGVRFVMPLSGSTRLYGIMGEVDAGTGPAVLPYTMTSRNGQSVTAALVIVPKARKRGRIRDRYVAFLTNIELDCPKKLLRHMPKTYRVRWGIETGYRVLEGARARTKSPKMAARLFFFFLSLAFYNFWSLCRQEQAVWAGKAMPMPMYDYADALWMYVAGEDRPP